MKNAHFLVFLLFTNTLSFAQNIGRGTNAPHATALLEIKASNMSHRFFAWVVCLSFFCMSTIEAQTVQQGSLSGVLVDKNTQRPISGAVLSLSPSNRSTLTDSVGSFQFVLNFFWLPLLNLNVSLGIDGISLFFILLTTLLIPLCLLASWNSVNFNLKEFLINKRSD